MSAPETQLKLTGVKCAGCVSKIEKALLSVPGVLQATVNFPDRTAAVLGTPSNKALLSAIKTSGFEATVIEPNTNNNVLISIPSISCASCVNKIEKAVNQLAGVTTASVNLADKTLSVEGQVELDKVLSSLEQTGFPGTLIDQEEHSRQQQEQEDKARYSYLLKHTAVALGLGIPLMAWGVITGEMSINNPSQQLAWGVVGLLTFLVLLFSGKHYFTGMWQSLKHRNANMDTLIATGTGAAWLYSMLVVLFPESLPASARHVYFEASAMIIGLINLGHALELRARGKTSEAVKKLLGLQVKTARVVRNNQDIDLPINQVVKGDILRIRPGEKIPVDGIVLEGTSLVDESMLTGEPVPVSKKPDESLAAGTLNKNGSLLIRAEKVGSETALAQIISLVKKAQSSKMPIARLADKIAGIFVPAVIVIAISAAIAWFYLGPDPKAAHMLVVFTTVLIIACPCALGLATPMSVMVGVGKAAEMGMLVRKGDALQQASKLTTLVMDKTGTITEGSPKVTDIVTISSFSESKILALAASIENSSEHPLAEAIVHSAKEKELNLSPVTDFVSITGHGITGKVQGYTLLLGNSQLMSQNGIAADALINQANALAAQGKTAMFIAIDNQMAGLIAVADPIRKDSVAAIQRLHKLGIKLVMLTGDNRLTAEAIAKEAGIDEVYAEVLPEDKDNYVAQLQQKGETVGMTGDGINDAPALARADVGFAIGAGTDVAIESADITLIRSSLHGLADAVELSRATLRNIKQNLFGAFIYNSLGIPVAAGILYPFTGMLLNPVIAGAAMALSSVTVVSNANRLKLFQPSRKVTHL